MLKMIFIGKRVDQLSIGAGLGKEAEGDTMPLKRWRIINLAQKEQ